MVNKNKLKSQNNLDNGKNELGKHRDDLWESKPEENQDDIKPIEKEEEENNQSNEDE